MRPLIKLDIETLKSFCIIRIDGCWVWMRSRNSGGYPWIRIKGGKTENVARIVLSIKLNKSLEDLEFACHSCDNPPCINPDHLFEGDYKTNTLDRQLKGRTKGLNSLNRLGMKFPKIFAKNISLQKDKI